MRCSATSRDVQQAVGSGEDFDECAEFRKTRHGSEIGLADLGRGRDVADHLERAVRLRPRRSMRP